MRGIILTGVCPVFPFYMAGVLLIQWFLSFPVFIYSEVRRFSLNTYLFPGLGQST